MLFDKTHRTIELEQKPLPGHLELIFCLHKKAAIFGESRAIRFLMNCWS